MLSLSPASRWRLSPKRLRASNVFVIDSRAMRLMIGPANGFKIDGTLRLSDSDSSSTSTSLPTCSYRQYEFRRHRNPRSLPSASAIPVDTLRLVASPVDRRWNVT
jgi:hypothetical protein